MGGVKDDQGKEMPHLIPGRAWLEVAKVFTYGAYIRPRADGSKGYGAYNWLGGLKFSRLTSAGMRHRIKHNLGIDRDEESGLYHLAHSIANDLMQLNFMVTDRKDLDDRYKEEDTDNSG